MLYGTAEGGCAMPPVEHRRPVAIGEVIKNAVAFNPKNWGSSTVNADSLPRTVIELLQLLREREITYVMAGGLAMLQYVQGRNTPNIDMIMALASLERVPEIEVFEQNADFARARFGDLQIDILLEHNRLFDRVRRQHAVVRQFAEQDIPSATVEGLVLLKLFALPSLYRQGDFARVGLYENDVATLMQAYQPPTPPLLDELARHMSETDLTAVRDIVADIQRRITRFEQDLEGTT